MVEVVGGGRGVFEVEQVRQVDQRNLTLMREP